MWLVLLREEGQRTLATTAEPFQWGVAHRLGTFAGMVHEKPKTGKSSGQSQPAALACEDLQLAPQCVRHSIAGVGPGGSVKKASAYGANVHTLVGQRLCPVLRTQKCDNAHFENAQMLCEPLARRERGSLLHGTGRRSLLFDCPVGGRPHGAGRCVQALTH